MSKEDLANRVQPAENSAATSESAEREPLGEQDFYWDGPYMVFTAAYHLRRGTCCNSGCRHCPYQQDS